MEMFRKICKALILTKELDVSGIDAKTEIRSIVVTDSSGKYYKVTVEEIEKQLY
jgi:hypothetical protein